MIYSSININFYDHDMRIKHPCSGQCDMLNQDDEILHKNVVKKINPIEEENELSEMENDKWLYEKMKKDKLQIAETIKS